MGLEPMTSTSTLLQGEEVLFELKLIGRLMKVKTSQKLISNERKKKGLKTPFIYLWCLEVEKSICLLMYFEGAFFLLFEKCYDVT
jgi:hypothetical protein